MSDEEPAADGAPRAGGSGWSRGGWIIGLAGLLLGYPLSAGPVYYACERDWLPVPVAVTFDRAYTPLAWLAYRNLTFGELYVDYLQRCRSAAR